MDDIIKILADELGKKPEHIENVIKLIDEGNTIPFIARYRKELHGAMDDTSLRTLEKRLAYLRGLAERRETVKTAIAEQGKLTEELKKAIDAATTLVEVEDLYAPFKQKRRTRATIAKEKGLEPLADVLFAQHRDGPVPIEEAAKYIDPEKGVDTAEAALSGASDILAERISDDAAVRKSLRAFIKSNGFIESRAATEDDSVYSQYYEFSQRIGRMQGHQTLAVNRGEKEKLLKVSVVLDKDAALVVLRRAVFKGPSPSLEFIKAVCEDAYTRLIFPSLEREIRSELTDTAAEGAIGQFALNLRPLLMQPPVKGKVTMGLDPGYRMGCKVAVVDATGKVLDTAVVYPTFNDAKKEDAIRTLSRLIRKHNVVNIAIGNGTASRETEQMTVELIRREKEAGHELAYMIVSEAGASVYSASELAAAEFPQFDVSLRSAVSIARRLQDPLAELVKIDPKAIGVGQYQHDLKPAELDAALGGVVEDCVNSVGVDVNTASVSLLSYVAGINTTVAKNIVAYREENGAFTTRAQLKKVPRLGPKAFEQCAGFLRIPGGKDLIENTGVHPESYDAARALLKHFSLTPAEAVGKLLTLADAEGFAALAKQLNVGEPTLRDIAAELSRPGRDPRDELPQVLMRSDVMDLKDLQPGMELRGTVRNVTDFGAFVDIGVHRDGLVHISQMAQRRVNHPSEVVRVGDIVTVWVLEADAKTNRISLTMRPPAKGEGNFSTTKSTQTKKLT